MKITTRKILLYGFYFIVAVFLVMLFMPQKSKQSLSYQVNRPWNNSLLMAPFDLPIFRDSVSAQILTDSIRNNFVPIYRVDNVVMQQALARVDAGTLLSTVEKNKIKNVLRKEYQTGILDTETTDRFGAGSQTAVRMINDNEIRTFPISQYYSQREAYMLLDSVAKRNVATNNSDLNLYSLIEPNVFIDTIENDRLLGEALLESQAAIGVIQQGERIIDRGDIVTPQLYQILKTYEEMMATRDVTEKKEAIYTDVGSILYIVLLFGALYAYFYLYRPEWWKAQERILCILVIIVGFYILGVLAARWFQSGLLIVPFTIVAILITVFYDSRTALYVYITEILLCLTLSTFPLEFMFVEFLGGMAAIISMKELSRRSQLLNTAGWVLASYILAYLAVELMITGTITSYTWKIIGFFAINAVLISFAYIMIFVIEKLFGFTSMVTLVELSDINNPMLLALSEQCPGTFQHSMAVSNLAADAARRLGANVQLVRTGALYHDIGKLANPAFFTENQHGVNPHDNLTATQSAKIIIGHIKEGMKRADKANLPKVIKDMITQHHGAGKAKYFYITECKRLGEENVNPADFAYPGPNPQSLEASLIMMADAVEAASRSLPDHSLESISQLVNRLIDGQIAEGLHADSPLSFRDVSIIKQTFINRLRTMYHSRIAYPSDIKPKPAAKS